MIYITQKILKFTKNGIFKSIYNNRSKLKIITNTELKIGPIRSTKKDTNTMIKLDEKTKTIDEKTTTIDEKTFEQKINAEIVVLNDRITNGLVKINELEVEIDLYDFNSMDEFLKAKTKLSNKQNELEIHHVKRSTYYNVIKMFNNTTK